MFKSILNHIEKRLKIRKYETQNMISKQFYLVLGIIVVVANLVFMLFLCRFKLKDRPKEKVKVVTSMLFSVIMVILLMFFICMMY